MQLCLRLSLKQRGKDLYDIGIYHQQAVELVHKVRHSATDEAVVNQNAMRLMLQIDFD